MLARGMAALTGAAGALGEQASALLYVSVFVLEDDPREALSAAAEAAELARRAGQRGLEVQNLLNAAETSLFLGEWNDTRAAIAELAPRVLPVNMQDFLECVKAMLIALTGDPADAHARLDRLAGRLGTSEFVSARTTYLEARSVVSLAGGDLEAAQREASEAVSTDPMGINSPTSLAIQAHASIWLRDVEGTRRALSAMHGFRGRWMGAERLTVEAGLAILENREEQGIDTFRAGIEAWRALNCTLDLALCELDLVSLLGPDHPDATVAKEAKDIFTQLGAIPFLARLS